MIFYDYHVPQKINIKSLDQWSEVVTYGQDGSISSKNIFFDHPVTQNINFVNVPPNFPPYLFRTPSPCLLIFAECAHTPRIPTNPAYYGSQSTILSSVC